MPQLRAYTKFEMRCILAEPSVNLNPLPSNFIPLSKKTFTNIVEPIFDDPDWQKQLGKGITLTKYKTIKTLPVKLVQVIFMDQGLSWDE